MTTLKKKKLYVGCALSHLPQDKKEEFLAMISEIRKELNARFETLEFLGTGPATPEEVYQKDIVECVGNADCMLAIWDYASGGLGYETCFAVEKLRIPVLAMAHINSSVSRLILGIHGEGKRYIFSRYSASSQIVPVTIGAFLSPGLPLSIV
jgi:hypothetical protein